MAPLIKSAGPLPYNTTGKILVRGANWIGDVIMGLPAVASIRRNFPKARIVVLAKPWVAAVYRRSPSVDEVVVYERPGIHGGLLGIMRLALKLRRERYGLTFLLQNAFEAAFIARLAGIPRRAGFATDCRGLLLTDAA
ncbi:MAG: glycosyltransferase family 9 protein, partial [Deltaproteobacteria bacterium]|nr:glycosyltransferase family 9 protein [Deltaproteobacteria bacterium]